MFELYTAYLHMQIFCQIRDRTLSMYERGWGGGGGAEGFCGAHEIF